MCGGLERGVTMKTITTTVYTYDELNDDAKENAYNEWLESVGLYDVEDQLEMGLDYDVRKTIEPIIPNWDADGYGNMWPIMRRVEMPADGHAPRMGDNGDCYSMDVADAFNEYGPQMEECAAMWCQVAFPEYGSAFYDCDDQTSYELMGMYEELYMRAFEQAAQAALNKWANLREDEREYLTSREAFEDEYVQGYRCRTRDNIGRVYCHDSRRLYTEDGEYYGENDVNHACISIVKVA